MGPVPLLWDRWRLAPGWMPRLELSTLLAEAGPGTELMLDLKGRDVRLSSRVAEAIARARPARITVCARNWALLEPLRDVPGLRIVHSVGSRRQLRALRRRFAGRRLGGRLDPPASCSTRRPSPTSRARSELVMTWPVATASTRRATLAGWGVDGVITERFDALLPGQAA